MSQRWIRLIGRMLLCCGMILLLHAFGGRAIGAIDSTAGGAQGMHSLVALESRGTERISQQSSPMSATSQQSDIDKLAALTTVVIAQDLQKNDVETGQAFRPGSGAIVAKAGNLYFAVTNLHVVPQVNVTYGVRTYDGEIHTAVPRRDRFFGIYRLGEQVGERVRGLDIAIIVFQSDKNYPVAGVNLSNLPTRGDAAFVSGWPIMPEGQPMVRRFSPGQIANVAPPSPDGGYGLFYTSPTVVGMSGGPVFNGRGEVIGIHGRGSSTQTQGANQGIQANSVATKAAEARPGNPMLSRFDFGAPASTVVAAARQMTLPPTANTFNDPEGAFRRAFLSSALRDCSPSRVDTGDPEDRCQ